jgi:hypothetical protein
MHVARGIGVFLLFGNFREKSYCLPSVSVFAPLIGSDEGAKSEKKPVPDSFYLRRSSYPVPYLYEQESPPDT